MSETTACFAKTQDAYSTAVADSIAPAGHTAFNWRREPEPAKKLTRVDKNREYAKNYFRDRYVPAAQRVKELTEFKGPVHNYGCMSETPQDRIKTAKLVGRNNSARSQ